MTDQNNGGSTPDQYALPLGAKELQDLIEYREMNFSLGNIFKACYRLGHCNHSDRMRDLNKIKWFVERMIAEENTKRIVFKTDGRHIKDPLMSLGGGTGDYNPAG